MSLILYGDTSALTKKYILEPGTETVLRVLAQAEGVFTSALTELELVVAVERAKRMRRLNSPTYRMTTATLERDLREKLFGVFDINRDILTAARRIARQRQLRGPDAIQLATALVANRDAHGAISFLCADDTLLEAALLEGLHCRDVSK